MGALRPYFHFINHSVSQGPYTSQQFSHVCGMFVFCQLLQVVFPMRPIEVGKPSAIVGFAKFISFTLIVLALTIAAFFWWFDRNFASDLRTTLNQNLP